MTQACEISEIAFDSTARLACVELRHQVLREPLGLKFSEAELAAEKGQWLLAALKGEQVVGCVLLAPLQPERVKMRQFAIAPPFQRRGIGTCLVQSAESLARERQVRVIELHARESVVPFYLSLGYEIRGGIFTEIGIPHQKMEKHLG